MKTSHIRNPLFLSFLSVAFILGVALVAPSGVLAADSDAHDGHGIDHASMGMIDNSNEPWAQKLKGQTIMEDAMEGRPNRAAMVEMQHNRLMEQMTRQVQTGQASNTGMFNGMSTMHQYDGQGYLLASQSDVEPVSAPGGRCPSTAPVKKYDISAINVEITLNQWLDFYPGYMYVLTENIEKVRAEEAKNKAARENGYLNDLPRFLTEDEAVPRFAVALVIVAVEGDRDAVHSCHVAPVLAACPRE